MARQSPFGTGVTSERRRANGQEGDDSLITCHPACNVVDASQQGRSQGHPDVRAARILAELSNSGVWCFGGLEFARIVAVSLLVPVLAAMLALTTPVGTAGREHQFELLHPVFPHAHLIDGRVVSAERHALDKTSTSPGAALGRRERGQALEAGDAADADGFGIGLVPTLPLTDMALPGGPEEELALRAIQRPAEFRQPPEDPPPNVFH